jgi:hypothetical protein
MPGQYRPSHNRAFAEESTFLEFKQQARGFIHREYNDWEMFFLMQHYRVPTRLLDWTENCLVALYFALMDMDSVGDPCVWMLNPFLFNKRNSPNHDSAIIVAPGSSDAEQKAWINYFHPLRFDANQVEVTDCNGQTENIGTPVAMCPPAIDQRIIAQRSVFTLHGQSRIPIDKCCEGQLEQKKDFIRQFIFKGNRREIIRELKCCGITRQSVFPDLEGLGMELRCRLAKEYLLV